MDRDSALKIILDIFEDVMDVDPAQIRQTDTSDDIEDWDSLSHVRLMIAIERRFGQRFSNAEIEAIGNVADIVDLVVAKSSA